METTTQILILCLLLSQVLGQVQDLPLHLGCYTENLDSPAFLQAIRVDKEMTAKDCCSSCLRSQNIFCGLTETHTCQCSNQAVGSTQPKCGDLCPADKSFCGVETNPTMVDVYNSGGGPPNFTLNVDELSSSSVSITVSYTRSNEEFFLEFGDNSPLVKGTSTAVSDGLGLYEQIFEYDLTMVPGTYTIQVSGIIPGTSLIYSQNYTLAPISADSSIDLVVCPELMEPTINYTCNVSTTFRDLTHIYIATFDDGNIPITLQTIGNVIKRIGIPVPKDETEETDPTVCDPFSVIKFYQQTIRIKSLLLALDYWPGDENPIEFKILSPSCPAGTRYCITLRSCLATCPYDEENEVFKCDDVFYPLDEACASTDTSGGQPPEWIPVDVYTDPGGPVTRNKHVRLSTPLQLEPGGVLQATGCLQRRVTQSFPGDTVDENDTSWHHYVSITVKEFSIMPIEHTCTTIMQNVTLIITDTDKSPAVWQGAPASTMCERNITDFALDINQTDTDAYNSTVNLGDPYFVRTTVAFNVRATFSAAGPIRFDLNFTPPNTPELTEEFLADYPMEKGPYEINIPRVINAPGVHFLSVSAHNTHNFVVDTKTGVVPGPITQELTIHALNEVTQTWILSSFGTQFPDAFLIYSEIPTFLLEDPSGAPFPTNATLSIDWGDNTPIEVKQFEDLGNANHILNHPYNGGGVFTISANISNAVSGIVDILLTVRIYEEIIDFMVTPKYFPSPTVPDPRSGFGRDRNQYPMDKNVAFLPSMTQGSVDTFLLKFTVNDSVIEEVAVKEIASPTTDFVKHFFPFETLLNLTMIAKNIFQEVSFDMYLEIVDQLRGLQIQHFDVTEGGEEKTFLITVESLGAASCVVVDYGDQSPYLSFGTEDTCKIKFSYVYYDPTIVLDFAVNITHTYQDDGMYNISAIGFNDVSLSRDMLYFPVTSLACTSPKIKFSGQILDYLASPVIHRGRDNFFLAIGKIDCDFTHKTKKRWQIYTVNEETGTIERAIPVMQVLPTWNKPELMIPSGFLNYGYHMLVYTITMSDPLVIELNAWIFQTQADHYIYVDKTPLQPAMTADAEFRVARGPDQSLMLEPTIHTIDPDFPDLKNYSVRWQCRTVGEKYPDPIPQVGIATPNSGGTGCFGHGPGLLKTSLLALEMKGRDFRALGETYEIEALLTKDTRKASAKIEVTVLPYNAPVLQVKCSAEALCQRSGDGDGVWVNAHLRLALAAECLEECNAPLAFQWKVLDPSKNPLALSAGAMPKGTDQGEFVLSTDFYRENPSLAEFLIHVEVTNSAAPPSLGFTTIRMKVNQRPEGGTCQIDAYEGFALIDKFTLTCVDWKDPEEQGIELYVVRMIDSSGVSTTLSEVRQIPAPGITLSLFLPAGEFQLEISVIDLWGANTVVTLPQSMKIAMISKKQFDAFEIEKTLQQLGGEGDIAALATASLAATSVVKEADWLDIGANCTGPEPACTAERQKRMLKINNLNEKAVEALLENADYFTSGSLEVSSGLLARIMDLASNSRDYALTIDILTRKNIYDVLEKMIAKAEELNNIGSAEQLRKLVENIGTIAGGLVLGVEDITNYDHKEHVSPKDFQRADSMPYDTDIGYDIELTIPDNVDDAQRSNIHDTIKEDTGVQMPRLEGIMKRLNQVILTKIVQDETLNVTTTNNMTVNIGMFKDLSGVHYAGNSHVVFPQGFNPQENPLDPVGLSMLEWPAPTYIAPETANMVGVGTRIFEINLYDKRQKLLPVHSTEKPILLSLYRTFGSRGVMDGPEWVFVNATYESKYQTIPIVYSKFIIDKEGFGANIQIQPVGSVASLFIIFSGGKMPTLRSYTLYSQLRDISVNSEGVMDWFIRSKDINRTGTYYIGIGQFKPNVLTSQRRNPMANKPTTNWLEQITTDYYFRTYTTGCSCYHNSSNEWLSRDLEVTGSDYEFAHCTTNHLTSFGSGLFVMPNTIDFSYVFANLGFSDNLTIYVTLIITVLIFTFLMIWARWKDKKDTESLGATPLPDNLPEERYLYEILVFTGDKKEAQTDSTVQFILTGERGRTGVRTFADNKRKILRKGQINVFVMTVARPLGPLSYLQIWHDNSGVGPNASWFLSYIVFRDVQTGEKYEFICNNWLALEFSDGRIERSLGVSEKTDRNFGHVYHNVSNRNLSDDHLWFSVFMRPPRSRFTRCQRVGTCVALLYLSMLVNVMWCQRVGTCVALLYLSMLANAMWYDTVPSQRSTGFFNIGPFNLSPAQMGVGLMSSLIVFPPSFLIAFFFRKARPRVLRKSRIEEALKKASEESQPKRQERESSESSGHLKTTDDDFDRNWDSRRRSEGPKDKSQGRDGAAEKRKKKKKDKKKKKFSLPWIFLYVAWLLVLVSVGVALLFLLLYGVMFGNERASKWLTSLILSFFSSVLFLQPLKVFVSAMFMSIVCKSVDLDEDDADEDEETPHLENDELWLYEGERSLRLGRTELDESFLEQMRRRRVKEVEMWTILMELFGYAVFICILFVLSYGQRDPNAFYLQRNFRNSFIHENLNDESNFAKVSNIDLLWYYLQNVFLGELRADVMYNGQAPYQLRGFLNDYANRIMGYATIRQIRGKKNSCSIPRPFENITEQCSGFTSFLSEESRNYCLAWVIPTTLTQNATKCQISEFRYQSAQKLKTLPYWGQSNWYGGGGYVIHLRGPTIKLLKKLNFLQRNFWIDEMTRAILIEFSSYNSQVNLFGICTLLAEVTPGGGIRPHYRFDGVRLLQHHDNFGAFIILCEVVFVIYVIYFTLHELKLLWKLKKRYFDSYWSYAELSIILVSYGAIIVYFLRAYETQKALAIFKATYGNGYVKMTYAAFMDEIFGYQLAFLVFVGSLKFIKLLRFNKRMGFLSATLHQCWDDLSGFLIAFIICFFSFVMMFYFLLSHVIENFSNFIWAFETSFSMMMGKFQFEEMKEANVLVPVIFFVFVLCTSWVLINLLLCIIIISFEQVKDDLNKQPNEYEMVEFLKERFREFLGTKQRITPLLNANPAKTLKTGSPAPIKKIDQLPEKVNTFLDYVNKIYFEGKMDSINKDSMAKSLVPRKIIGSDLDHGIDSGRVKF